MKIYNELESLGFFEWLSETHNLKDTDMTPECLDELLLDDIHRTVCNSMAFRWFREKYGLHPHIFSRESGAFVWCVRWYVDGLQKDIPYDSSNTYEEAELECLKKLISIVKKK